MTPAGAALIADLDAATGPDRLLDARIAVLREGGESYVLKDRPGWYRIPGVGSISSVSIYARHYTAGLPAARALVRSLLGE